MIAHIKRTLLLLSITAVIAAFCPGCQTAHGFGKDMENAGEGIQKGTR